jgi:hypothetical protein
MRIRRNVAAILVSLTVVCTAASTARAANCEDLVERHMVAEALLVVHLVASAEKTGMKKSPPDDAGAVQRCCAAGRNFCATGRSGHAASLADGGGRSPAFGYPAKDHVLAWRPEMRI